MINKITTIDGQIGYSASKPPVTLVGSASAGPLNAVSTFGDASQIRGTYPAGRLPDRASLLFTASIGAETLLRMGQSGAGSLGPVQKVPASKTGTAVEDFGAILLPGADFNGDLLFVALQDDVTLTLAVGMAESYAVVGKDVTITVTNASTGTTINGLALGAAAPYLATPLKYGTGASVCGQVLAKTGFNPGTILYTALGAGCYRVPGADANGDIVYLTSQSGISVQQVVSGVSTIPYVERVNNLLKVHTATDGASAVAGKASDLAALVNADPQSAALGITALSTGTGNSKPAAIAATPLAALHVANVAAGNNTALSVALAASTVTITDSTGAHAQPSGTGLTIQAALVADPASAFVLSPSLFSTGTGVNAPLASTVLPFGSTGAITVSGNPLDDYNLQVLTPRAGGVGVGSFRVALDDLPTYGPEILIPGGGTYLISGTGITLTFSGTFGAGDVFLSDAEGATSTTGDLNTALGVLSGLTGQGGDMAICGGLSGAQATVVTTWIAQERLNGRIWVCQIESRDYNDGETEAQYIAAVNADFAGVLEPQGRLWGVPGWWDTVIPNQGISRRPFAWAAGAQVWSLPSWVNPICEEDGGGQIPNLYTPQVPIQPQTHDERLNPGLGGSGGRWATVQSSPGVPGAWYLSDAAGLRSPGTFAGGLSDYSLLMNARLAAFVERLLLAFGPQLLGSRYNAIPPGQPNAGALTSAARKKAQGKIAKMLNSTLGEALEAPAIVVISPTEPIKTSKKLKYTVTLPTWAYVQEIDGALGLQ